MVANDVSGLFSKFSVVLICIRRLETRLREAGETGVEEPVLLGARRQESLLKVLKPTSMPVRSDLICDNLVFNHYGILDLSPATCMGGEVGWLVTGSPLDIHA